MVKGKNDVIGIKVLCWGKLCCVLKWDVVVQVKVVGGVVIENFLVFCQFGDQLVGIGIDVKQMIVDLSGQCIDNQVVVDFLWIKGINLVVDVIDEIVIVDIGVVGECRGGKSWFIQQGNGCQER